MKTFKKLTLAVGVAVAISGATVASAQETDLPDELEQPVVCQFNFAQQPNLENVAESLGMTVEDLQAALDEGQTIRDIADELGVELPTPDRGNGQQTQARNAQSDTEESELTPFLNQNQNFENCPDPETRLAELAELFDMTVEELQAALDEGQTIRDIAEELEVELPEPPRGPQGPAQFGNQNGQSNGQQNGQQVPQGNQNGQQQQQQPQGNQNGQQNGQQQPPVPGNGGPQGPGNQNGQAGPPNGQQPQGGPQGPQRPA